MSEVGGQRSEVGGQGSGMRIGSPPTPRRWKP